MAIDAQGYVCGLWLPMAWYLAANLILLVEITVAAVSTGVLTATVSVIVLEFQHLWCLVLYFLEVLWPQGFVAPWNSSSDWPSWAIHSFFQYFHHCSQSVPQVTLWNISGNSYHYYYKYEFETVYRFLCPRAHGLKQKWRQLIKKGKECMRS